MALQVNEARGEVLLRIDDIELVIAAEMKGLAALSSRLQCQSLAELWGRLSAMEVNAVLAGIETLTVRGDAEKAVAALKVRHFKDCQTAFITALNHQVTSDEGKKEAARSVEAKASPGGDGRNLPSAA